MPLTVLRLIAAVLAAGALAGPAVPLLGPHAALASAAAVALAALLISALVACAVPAPPAVPVTAATLRRRAPGAGPPRQHDPDAAGRPRPRAPSPA